MILAGLAIAPVQLSPLRTSVPAFVALSGPTRTSTCTVRQVDANSYEATVTWSGFSPTSIVFLQGSAVLSQSQLAHERRSGSLTETLQAAPSSVDVNGKKVALKTACSMVA